MTRGMLLRAMIWLALGAAPGVVFGQQATWQGCTVAYGRAADAAEELARLEPQEAARGYLHQVAEDLRGGAGAAAGETGRRVLCSDVHLVEVEALRARYEARIAQLRGGQTDQAAERALQVVERELDRTQ